MGTFVLFTLACLSSGPSWEWNSVHPSGAWMLFGGVFFTYIIQQSFSIGAARERRIIPCSLLRDRTVLLTWVCTACAAAACGLIPHYTPIYFSMMRIHGQLDATSRLVPFLCAFVASALLSGALLGHIRAYRAVFMAGAALLAVGSGLLHGVTPDTVDDSITSYEALAGAGAGTLWHLATAVCVCAAGLPLPPDRHAIDQAALQGLAQLGGLAAARSAAAVLYHGAGSRLFREAAAAAALTVVAHTNATAITNNNNNNTAVFYSDQDVVRELLSGVRPAAVLAAETNPDTVVLVFEIVVAATVHCLTLLVIAAAAAFVAACCLGSDEPDFRNPRLRPWPDARHHHLHHHHRRRGSNPSPE